MLLGHVHPPPSDLRNWKGFRNEWASYLSADPNRRLPVEWFAAAEVDFGVEIDVATLQESRFLAANSTQRAAGSSDVGGWPPADLQLTLTLPVTSDVAEVQVNHTSGGGTLVGAIALVSPRNKDRAESRPAFVATCESRLVAGVGKIIVDVVTDRRANLHRSVLERFESDLDLGELGADDRLYVAADHPVPCEQASLLDVWHEPPARRWSASLDAVVSAGRAVRASRSRRDLPQDLRGAADPDRLIDSSTSGRPNPND